jgi:hypothetical protein
MALLLDTHARSAMTADVEERAWLPIAATHDDNAFANHLSQQVVAWPCDLCRTANADPAAVEDSLDFT